MREYIATGIRDKDATPYGLMRSIFVPNEKYTYFSFLDNEPKKCPIVKINPWLNSDWALDLRNVLVLKQSLSKRQ